MKKILFLHILLICFTSCSNKRNEHLIEVQDYNNIKPATKTIDIEINKSNHRLLSDLIKDIKYIELQETEDAFMYPIKNVKIIDSLIYIQDTEDQLKCFNFDGKFIRNAYKKGNGPDEVIRLYDFDVDDKYLYILDGTSSVILKYTHTGVFINRQQLGFRAIRFKRMMDGNYLFELAPYTLNKEDESYTIAITDSAFFIKDKFLNRTDNALITRTPYFENQTDSKYFSPIYGRSIYQIEGDSLFMKYYLNFGTPYQELNKKNDDSSKMQNNGSFYTYDNPMHNKSYLIQNFVLSKENMGLLVLELSTGKHLFVRNIENDMDDVYNFDFIQTKFYDIRTDYFVSSANVYYTEFHSNEEIIKAREHLNDSIEKIVIKDGIENNNQVLMLYRLHNDIIK